MFVDLQQKRFGLDLISEVRLNVGSTDIVCMICRRVNTGSSDNGSQTTFLFVRFRNGAIYAL